MMTGVVQDVTVIATSKTSRAYPNILMKIPRQPINRKINKQERECAEQAITKSLSVKYKPCGGRFATLRFAAFSRSKTWFRFVGWVRVWQTVVKANRSALICIVVQYNRQINKFYENKGIENEQI
jgi:hypothetical protein